MEETKLIAKNPNARHNYDIKNTIEAGIELTGTEIKSIRNGKINLKDSYAVIKNGEVFLLFLFLLILEVVVLKLNLVLVRVRNFMISARI